MTHKFLSTIYAKFIPFERVSEKRNQISGTLIFTNGCFDLLHKGHLTYLAEARDLGDVLWVGINSDASVKRLKGNQRPILGQDDRMFQLASLEVVSFVTIFEEDTPIPLLQNLQPSIHCKGGDYSLDSLPEKPIIESFGGKIVLLPFLKGNSTSGIIEKIQNLPGASP